MTTLLLRQCLKVSYGAHLDLGLSAYIKVSSLGSLVHGSSHRNSRRTPIFWKLILNWKNEFALRRLVPVKNNHRKV